jgi:hypothetical protein
LSSDIGSKIFLVLACFLFLGVDSFKRLEKIIITDPSGVSLRSSSYFPRNYEGNVLSTIPAGTEAKIIGFDTRKTKGIGIKVEVSVKGKKKTGWVYYHTETKDRTIDIHDYDNKKIDTDELFEKAKKLKSGLSKIQFYKNWFTSVDDYKQKTNSATHVRTLEESPIVVDLKNSGKGYVWKKIAKGTYKIDVDNYRGGKWVPILIPEIQEDGTKVSKIFYMRRDINDLISAVNKVPTVVESKPPCREENLEAAEEAVPERPDVVPLGPVKNWLKGCHVLAKKEKMKVENDYASLNQCWESIQDALGTINHPNRDNVYENMYKKLNPHEKRFMAMVASSVGEAGILSRNKWREMHAVMKVIDNRLKYAKDRGDEINPNEIDIILQDSQFSMYNGKDREGNWESTLLSSTGRPELIRAIKAYISYPHQNFGPKNTIDKVYHYHASYRYPSWRHQGTIVKVKVNDKDVDGKRLRYNGVYKQVSHKFYKGVPWTYESNLWRSAYEGAK